MLRRAAVLVAAGLLTVGVSACGGGGGGRGSTEETSAVAVERVPTWVPCENIPPDAVEAAGLREPTDDAWTVPYVRFVCGFLFSDIRGGVSVSTNAQTLEDRRNDYRFETVEETSLDGNPVVISGFLTTACHYTIGIDPGYIDIQVGYSPGDEWIPDQATACDLAVGIAETFAPYFPKTLD